MAYIINFHWDQKLPKKCEKCGSVLNRSKYRKHISTCSMSKGESMETDIEDNETTKTVNETGLPNDSIKLEINADDARLINSESEDIDQTVHTKVLDEICKYFY